MAKEKVYIVCGEIAYKVNSNNNQSDSEGLGYKKVSHVMKELKTKEEYAEYIKNGKAISTDKKEIVNVDMVCYFEVEREYVETLKQEYLNITAYIVNNGQPEERAKEQVTILEVEDCVTRIVGRGIGLRKREIAQIKQKIEDEYPRLQIKKTTKNGVGTKLAEVLQMYCEEYSAQLENKENNADSHDYRIEDGHFCIHVKKFGELYKTSDYADTVSEGSFRRYLREQGITKCNAGRSDCTVANMGKTICFKIDELEKFKK